MHTYCIQLVNFLAQLYYRCGVPPPAYQLDNTSSSHGAMEEHPGDPVRSVLAKACCRNIVHRLEEHGISLLGNDISHS